MKNIALLGSTGSVGKNVLNVVRSFPGKFRVKAISSNRNVSLLAEQADEFRPEVVAIGDEGYYSSVKEKLSCKAEIISGPEGFEKIASLEEPDIVFISISGTAALRPLMSALNSGKTVALASKEPVVSAGKIIMDAAKKSSSLILPVDSEHSAIMQCLSGKESSDVKTLYITGSGGSLKDVKKEDFGSLSVEKVLAHPKWQMGQKITVDSATLMNKGLEAIEARWLFDIAPGKIKVVIHPEAIVHSMVEFMDGTISASLFYPDMRFPILKALAFPETIENDFPRVDFSAVSNLSFSEPDNARFPALRMAFDALDRGGTMPAVLNGANEAAVSSFLSGKIAFTRIVEMVGEVLSRHKKIESPTLDQIIDSEKWAYEEVFRSC